MLKKYKVITEWVQEEIRKGSLHYRERIPSEKELAEQFGVSRQTVRRALEDLNEAGIVESRRGSGTYVSMNARRPERGETRIAVMLTYVDTYIFPSIIRGIESELSREGCILQIAVNNNAVEKERMVLREFIRTRSVDGLIAEAVKSGLPNPNLDLYRELEKMGIPVLFVNSYYRDLDLPHVSLDDRKAGYLAARHLLECGHTKIGGIFKSDDGQGHFRYAGYTDALMEREIKVLGSRIIWLDSGESSELEEESRRILKRLKDCTACVCYNDEVAYKLTEILRKEAIRVPEDMSVVGIDNSAMAEFCPVPLTSVRNPVEELGRSAALRMVGKIFRGEEMESEEFAPELVIRNSVRVMNRLI